MSRRIMLLLAAALLVVGVAACGGDDDEGDGGAEGKTGGTLVFAGAADPVVIDGALVSDGESIRVITQIFETLINLKPGTTELEPGLATEWEVSPDAKTYTFALREGVKFHDGTDFNAEAVCFNFDRWFNFKGPLQSPSASYYYGAFFGGFKKNESEDLSPPLYKSCEARNPTTAVITLTRPSASLLGALVQQAFSIASPDALKKYNADAGTLDEETGFRPTGTFGTEHPIGTGPFEFVSWQREDRLVLKRFDDYWGEKAKLDQLIIRPIADNAARLQALQNDEIQGYDLVEPQDVSTIEGDDNLKIEERPAFNVAYVGINQAKKPMDNLKVRQAVAYGLDRQAVVDNFYGGRGVVAKQMMPPEVEGYADSVPEYSYDPDKAKQLLQEAGLTLPVKVDFWYPSDVSRPYMPNPKNNFEAFASSLNKSGFKVVPHTAPWDPDYLGRVDEGNAGHLHLIGWTGDFADADNFIGTFFQDYSPQFGFRDPKLFKLLDDAEIEADRQTRIDMYKEANQYIMEQLPAVPYAHTKPALAFRKDVEGFVPSPTTNELFSTVTIGGGGE
ncbi:MAG TPA: ABC transporter substrate-binding protein [Gaiellaceae bacterium]|nr:ABC transporter substrate-binding protein [Gaiellaceae bacterium]HET8653816.1 ABC transporter substrate-binding protein [Gaiellaceae bacterium]